MEDTTRDKICKLIQSGNISVPDFMWLVDQRTLDEDRGVVRWNDVPPQALDMMFRTGHFNDAFLNVRSYFEYKWNLTKLQLKKKIILIDSAKGNIYGG